MNKIFLIALAAVALFAASMPCHANPWVQDEGRQRFAVTAAFSTSHSVYDDNGTEIPMTGDVDWHQILFTYEEGMADKTEFSIQSGFNDSSPEIETPGILDKNNVGIMDTWVRYKWQFRDQSLDAAVLTGVKIPGSYNKNTLNAPGEGQFDLEAGVSAGQYLEAPRVYWSVDAVYRFRLGAPADEFVITVDAGRIFTDRINTRVFYTKIDSTGGAGLQNTPLAGGTGSFNALEVDKDLAGIGIHYRVGTSREVIFSYVNMLDGKNTLDTDEFFLTYVFMH